MSLTSLIKNDKELREKIRTTFSRPKLEKNKPLLVEPCTKRHSLVGTAFDYLFRFYLERINKVGNKSKIWVAEKTTFSLNGEVHDIGIDIVDNVKKLQKKFMKTGELSTDLIRQTLRMSYLDPVFRSGSGVDYIGEDADAGDIEDIKKQFELIDESLFRAKNICLLNPTFGKASKLVGGADADLLIDDKLIDIKTTKKLELKLADYCQVIGYLILHKISGIDERKEIEINKLGIYYSRYGYLFSFNIQDIIDDKSLQSFTEWFENRIR